MEQNVISLLFVLMVVGGILELVSSRHLKNDNVNHSSANEALISTVSKANHHNKELGKLTNRSRGRNISEH